MEISLSAATAPAVVDRLPHNAPVDPGLPKVDSPETKAAFHDFVGQTFFSHMLSAMRKTVGKPAYFHGGRAEEVFQNQLDQVLSEHLAKAGADAFVEPMYELFMLPRP
jgi:peptidoglycan hydrolase FlgJ